MKTSNILDKAADEIERRGWHQGGFISEPNNGGMATCKVCALGAIILAAGERPSGLILALRGRAVDAAATLAKHLALQVDSDEIFEHQGLIQAVGNEWNDNAAQTAEQVIDALRDAAAAERSAGR